MLQAVLHGLREYTARGEGSTDILLEQAKKLWATVSVTHDILADFMFFIDWQYSSQFKIKFNLLLPS